jgi:putative tryptophan/tyrosine transport system substrate-binding protein
MFHSGQTQSFNEVRAMLADRGIERWVIELLSSYTATFRKSLAKVTRPAGARRPDGLLMLTAPLMSIYSKHIAELTLKYRLPAISMFSSFARAGGLMAYGPNLEDLYREVGVMTGKILKGTKPADLPAERPARFELVVNLKAAKALDLNISNLVLARADEVIE